MTQQLYKYILSKLHEGVSIDRLQVHQMTEQRSGFFDYIYSKALPYGCVSINHDYDDYIDQYPFYSINHT